MASDHEDFAYNSLKVSEGLVLESIPLAAAFSGTWSIQFLGSERAIFVEFH